MKQPETVRLFIELNGGNLEWWEPLSVQCYKVCVHNDGVYVVTQFGSEISARRSQCS